MAFRYVSRHATCASLQARFYMWGAAGVRPEVEARPWPRINPAPNSDEAPEFAAGEPRERNHEREMTPSSDLPNSSLTFRALQLYDRSGARALALLASDALSAWPFDLEGATGRVCCNPFQLERRLPVVPVRACINVRVRWIVGPSFFRQLLLLAGGEVRRRGHAPRRTTASGCRPAGLVARRRLSSLTREVLTD